ncbi:MAG: flagellar hook-associated protein FlgK [Thermotogaceae bacterium]|nr:flagellar hook-associated protein FlgK [Thermotogaceae bacterium]
MADLTLFALLNTSLLGVYTHKLAMDVTAHNVSNANTKGYSRQRPAIEAMPPIPLTTLAQPSMPLQIGTGSRVKSIERVRDQFLDIQFRQVNNRYNFWDTVLSNLHFLEQLFSEPGENGIRSLYDMFWSGMEDVITDPTNVAAKQELVSRANVLINNMKDLYGRIGQLRDDINIEIKERVDSINLLLEQIAALNSKIRIGTALGSPPNDLMDKRDLLLDKLSELVDVHYHVAKDGQVYLRIGDQVVVNGGTYNKLRVLQRPYGKGYYEIFIANSKLNLYDGKLKALLDLRDNTLVKYMKRLDEFVLFLTDKVNLIHREGFTANGVTDLNFFVPITATGEDPAIFRLMGSRKMVGGPIGYVTGLHGIDDTTIESTPFLSNGKLVFFYDNAGTYGFDEKDITSGSTIGDYEGTILSVASTSIELNVGNKRLYLQGSDDLTKGQIIDVTGTVLRTMGLSTKTNDFLVISEDDVTNAQGKTYTLTFSYTDENGNSYTENFNVDLTASADLSTIRNAINSNSQALQAHIYSDPNTGKNFLMIVPTYNVKFDINAVDIQDPQGLFTAVNAQIKPFVVLDYKPTVENITGYSDKFTIYFGSTPIEIDPRIDTLEDIAKKINESNVGVLADVTPHGRLVLRAGRMYDFDLRNVQVKGPKQFFEEMGIIEKDATDDWLTDYALIDATDSYDDIRNRLDKSEFLTFDRNYSGEPFRIVNQFSLSSTIAYSPENIATDEGYVVENPSWDSAIIKPTGRSNTEIMKRLSQIRFERLLDDGKVLMGEFFGAVVAEMGVEGELANKMKVNNELLRKEIDNAREQVKGVSLDEEMANMIKYQHAFNASARVISAVDEMIGRVIDRLGVVGR